MEAGGWRTGLWRRNSENSKGKHLEMTQFYYYFIYFWFFFSVAILPSKALSISAVLMVVFSILVNHPVFWLPFQTLVMFIGLICLLASTSSSWNFFFFYTSNGLEQHFGYPSWTESVQKSNITFILQKLAHGISLIFLQWLSCMKHLFQGLL